AERDLADGRVRVERSRHHCRALPPDDQAAYAEERDLHGVLVGRGLRDERGARPGRDAGGEGESEGNGEDGGEKALHATTARGGSFRSLGAAGPASSGGSPSRRAGSPART